MFELEKVENTGAKIKVIGVGGCGCNAVNNMIAANLKGVDFLACNTDIQTLKSSLSPNRVQIGTKLTRGLGAGGDPEMGKSAAQESEQEIRSSLEGADMVFITAGMGGGTGTGASPIVARIARDMGALTVGVVTKPFPFEGKRKMKQAESGEKELSEHVDALIVIPNNRLLSMAGKNVPMLQAFRMADDILTNAVRGISDLINNTGLVNVDFNDVRAVMVEKGKALMGIGYGSGESRAQEAAQAAISSPLLEDMDIQGAKGLLINITSGQDITMDEIHEASTLIQSAAHEDANIIWGVVIDENMHEQMAITVVATGFSSKPIVLSSTTEEPVISRTREKQTATVIDYNRPAFMRKKELGGEKEVVRLGMVVDDSILDEDTYNVPTFLRKKAD
ncbi:MAG: cell division protein FtsZ [Desulfomonilia bacterium]|jgi:cell division protein FtsZ|uniref:GTP-binding tubulin-like cell division protein n=1 Tax=anaerobic digester metagenome TaxID=1263854 RepID=A0A485M3D7_9ZZZZ|nr:cell division protein FtsZ [Pseudomonadota bacterium]HON38098.1 cell division protein FtsZ [Deltaproteobacteria bacterium]HRS56256.1 cell division protein FtsZ [Desulfomonilia bacterium]HPD21708.1 cell division protein FtsZ [Deltaproteobacteria bacterium]HPX18979.1 cell division protein FtsZ [Deltaproteobacteria bacterium]